MELGRQTKCKNFVHEILEDSAHVLAGDSVAQNAGVVNIIN
jgi:hypothetical protein